MLLTTTENVPGKRVTKVIGLVQGSTVRAKHVGRDIAAGLKSIVGGELGGYTELLIESRNQSIQRMIEQAQRYGANAVVGIRFTTSAITPGASELFCYGTAMVLEDE